MKAKTGGVTIEKCVGLKSKMYSFLVDDSSEYRHAKDFHKNVVATIKNDEYKDVLLVKNI